MDRKTLRYFKIAFNFEIPLFMVCMLISAYKQSIFWMLFFLIVIIIDIFALRFVEKKLK
ncbi:hypothetical protein [Clostridium senegalense]|uniref:hypothetical protein n=1 Tax=Clostridium senegalense TaxID=1465809 RepID=UPI0002DB14FC|nr:hypothetical protein [Clostridium senegalense]MBU5227329.1 hypothetical protein [Clostridium senegalense]